jgi:hypothetical protein
MQSWGPRHRLMRKSCEDQAEGWLAHSTICTYAGLSNQGSLKM